jgi:hypothetical protein
LLRFSSAEADMRVWKREALLTKTKVASTGTTWFRPPSRERQPP